MLEIKNLTVGMHINENSSNNIIINNVNFKINIGEFFALVGESGSGKSMTALSIMRLLPTNMCYSQASKIMLNGTDILTISEKRMQKIRGANIAMIFQDPLTSLNPVLTIGVQILECIRLHQNITGRYAYIEALRLLEEVQLTNPERCFASYPHQLSGGMRQRVMIAMALAGKPELLIADEPTTALDVITQRQILDLLQNLQRSTNMAILVITHDLSIAKQYADRVGVMHAGIMVEENSKTEFFNLPRHEYSQKLLNCVPKFTLHNQISVANEIILDVAQLNVNFTGKHRLFSRKCAETRVLTDINITLFAGQTLALVGGSGSGKSTLGKALLGLLPNVSGNVIYKGKNLLTLNSKQMLGIRSQIQIIFQDSYSALNQKLRVVDSLEEGLLLHGTQNKAQRYKKIDELLIQVGLNPDAKFRYPHQFSGGERQRLCIARALAVEPKILICDEPTSSLDVSVQAQILNLLVDLQQQRNLTYLFISHDLKVVSRLAHTVAVMHNGKIIEQGAVAQVFANPKENYTKELLNAIAVDL